jgi:ubiquinone/menaquinone biosynthesis C-methylase UbiE
MVDPHEVLYQDLKANGAQGWGAQSFEKRMEGWNRTLEWALPFFPKAPANVLDIGCGAGDSALPLARRGYKISGLDLSETAIHWAIEKFQKQQLSGDFRVESLTEALSWDDSTFDVIVDSATLHCILPPEREKAFTSIKRILKKDAVFLLSSMVGEPKDSSNLEFYDPVQRIQQVKGLPRRYTPELNDLKAEIKSYGFQIKEEKLQENSWWNHYNAILVKQK